MQRTREWTVKEYESKTQKGRNRRQGNERWRERGSVRNKKMGKGTKKQF